MRLAKLGLAVVLAICGSVRGGVSIAETEKTIVMDNGVVALTFAKRTAQVTSIRSRVNGAETEVAAAKDGFYWDCNTEPLASADKEAGAESTNAKGYSRYGPLKSFEVVANTPERGELVAKGGPGVWLKFEMETHFVMFAGDSGWYSYVVIRHPEDQPAARLWQTRFVAKVDTKLFDEHFVGSDRIVPISKGEVVAKVMDATYKMADGSFNTKYNNSVYWAASPVYGMASSKKGGLGIFSVSATSEYYNGGPVKQGQTVHDGNLLRVLQSVHFGASPVDVGEKEKWGKVYGPFFTYINTEESAQAMWDDAQARQKAEAGKWPYDWVTASEYAKVRGTVKGRWALSGASSTEGAWVILAAPGGDWPAQSKGYQFFVHTGADGVFEIPKVIPGTYSMYLVGADQPEQFEVKAVEVKAGETKDLGTVNWPAVTHGKTLWQIGTFDRSAGEFRNGDDARHFEVFRKYQEQFPNDVKFEVGKSDIKKDWSHAQWIWFNKDPFWTVGFEVPKAVAGKATLTMGFAAAQPAPKKKETELLVKLNGVLIDTVRLPKTGTSGYRGGVQDSQYNVKSIEFDASLLKLGHNELVLQHAGAEPFPAAGTDVQFQVGHVMYDAIRLEVPE